MQSPSESETPVDAQKDGTSSDILALGLQNDFNIRRGTLEASPVPEIRVFYQGDALLGWHVCRPTQGLDTLLRKGRPGKRCSVRRSPYRFDHRSIDFSDHLDESIL